MKNNTSKAQSEIWDAKETLYNEMKSIPFGKKISFLHSKTKKTIDKYFKDKIVRLQTH